MALIEGRQKIENGWCKHALKNGKGEVCILGAIKDSDHLQEACMLLRNALPEEWQLVPMSIANYNNARSTIKVDILALFDRAIALGMGG